MNVLASHPFYIKREEVSNSDFLTFVSKVKDKGCCVKLISSSSVIISQTKNSPYNNIIVCFPEKSEGELAQCRFYNADFPFSPIPQTSSISPIVGMGIWKLLPLMYGHSLKNGERILGEPFCSEILSIFLSSVSVYKCPTCGEFTFKRDNWVHEDSRFTEERITHGLNAIANILFLGGHGAGGEWSQATKQRYKYEGFNLTCVKCGHTHKITTSILPL